jgi:hypothetical protein
VSTNYFHSDMHAVHEFVKNVVTDEGGTKSGELQLGGGNNRMFC